MALVALDLWSAPSELHSSFEHVSVIDWYARKSPSVDGQSIAHAQRKRSSESQADSLKNSWLKIGNLSKNSGIACLAFLLFLSSRQRINLQKRIQETIGTIICLLNPRFLELISWVVKVRARQVSSQEFGFQSPAAAETLVSLRNLGLRSFIIRFKSPQAPASGG